MSGALRSPYIGDKTRVVLSFANANGGDTLAHWLRQELMKKLDYFSPNAVYLDNVGSRQANGAIHHAGGVNPFSMSDANPGRSIMGPDTRGRELNPSADGISESGKYLTIGAVHSKWKENWIQALFEAKVVIQIQSPDYFSSNACAAEVARIALAVMDGNNRNLKLLALAFTPDIPKMVVNNVALPNMTPMQVQKTTPENGPFAQLKGAVRLSGSSLNNIITFLRQNGC